MGTAVRPEKRDPLDVAFEQGQGSSRAAAPDPLDAAFDRHTKTDPLDAAFDAQVPEVEIRPELRSAPLDLEEEARVRIATADALRPPLDTHQDREPWGQPVDDRPANRIRTIFEPPPEEVPAGQPLARPAAKPISLRSADGSILIGPDAAARARTAKSGPPTLPETPAPAPAAVTPDERRIRAFEATGVGVGGEHGAMAPSVKGSLEEALVQKLRKINEDYAPTPSGPVRAAQAAGHMVTHPIETVYSLGSMIVEPAAVLGAWSRQGMEKSIASTKAGLAAGRLDFQNPPAVESNDIVSDRDAAFAAGQILTLGATEVLAGALEGIFGARMANAVVKARRAGKSPQQALLLGYSAHIASRALVTGGAGAVYSPEDPEVGFLLGAAIGGVHAAAKGLPWVAVPEAEYARGDLSRTALPARTPARAKVTVEAPPEPLVKEPDYTVEDLPKKPSASTTVEMVDRAEAVKREVQLTDQRAGNVPEAPTTGLTPPTGTAVVEPPKVETVEEARARRDKLKDSRRWTVENAKDDGSSITVRAVHTAQGDVAVTSDDVPDDGVHDITAQLKAGIPIETAIARTYGAYDQSKGEEPPTDDVKLQGETGWKSDRVGKPVEESALEKPAREWVPPAKGVAASTVGEAETGRPFKATLYRGEGGDNPYNADAGIDKPILGAGRYTTPDKAHAAEFGPKLTEHQVALEKPLVIASDQQWRALTKEAGWEFPNPVRLDPAEKPIMDRDLAAMRALLEKKGHDGVVVRIPRGRAGDIDERIGKTLYDVFGGDQVVEFNKRPMPAVGTAEKASLDESIAKLKELADTPVKIASGQKLRTEGGREITVPKLKGTDAQRYYQLHAWLAEEAALEAKHQGNDHAYRIFRSITHTRGQGDNWTPRAKVRLTPADVESANDVLFGDERGVKERHLLEHGEAEPPAPELKVERPAATRKPVKIDPKLTARHENGALRTNLRAVPTEALERESHAMTEANHSEEAAHAAIMEAGYRSNYEELPRTEKLGHKGKEDLPDADGEIDSEKLAAHNKTIREYNSRAVIRKARQRSIERIETELRLRRDEADRAEADSERRAERSGMRGQGKMTGAGEEEVAPGVFFDPSGPDLFGEEAPAPKKPEQGSMFGGEEGTETAREKARAGKLKPTEEAARRELDALKAKLVRTLSPAKQRPIKERIALLEKLVNRAKAITKEELATRASAEAGSPDYSAMSDDEFFATTGGLKNADPAVQKEVYRRIDANKAKRDQRSAVESPIRAEILRRLAGEEDFESLKKESTESLIEWARNAEILSASELAALERRRLTGDVVDDVTAKRVGMPRELQDGINLLGEERAWMRAVMTPGEKVVIDVPAESALRSEGAEIEGTIVEGAVDPVNSLGKNGMALVEHMMEGATVQRWYRALYLRPADADLEGPAPQGTLLSPAPDGPTVEDLKAAETTPAAARAKRGDVKSLKEIVDNLADMAGVPIRQGRFGAKKRKALGVFIAPANVARVVRFDKLDTAAHEVGHYISRKYLRNPTQRGAGARGAPPLSMQMKRELVKMGKDLYGSRKPAGGYGEEGIAQWARFYVMDPAQLTIDAPTFTAWAEANVLKNEPGLKAALDAAREDYKAYRAAPATARIDAMINTKPESRLLPDARKLATWFLDDLAEIRRAVEELNAGGVAPADPARNAYTLARLTRGGAGMAEDMLTKGIIDKDGLRVTRGLEQILKGLKRGELQELRRYLVAERALEVAARGVNAGIELKDAQAAVRLYAKKYGDIAKEIWSISQALIDYRVAKGNLTPAEGALLKKNNAKRVGFYRVFNEDERAAPPKGVGKGFGRNSSGLQKIRGSARQIIDPLESIITDIYKTVQQSLSSEVMAALVKHARRTEGGGAIVEELLEAPQELVAINIQKVMSQLKELGMVPEGQEEGEMSSKEISGMLYALQDKKTAGAAETKDLVRPVVIDGERKWIQLKDAQLFDALSGLGTPEMQAWLRWLSVPTRTVRAGATLTLEFLTRNPARDAVTAAIYSRAGFRPPGFDFVRGLFHVLKQDGLYDRWRQAGGDNAAMLGIDRPKLQKHLQEIMRGQVSRKAGWILRPIDTLRLLSSLFENATRVGEYAGVEKKARAAGATPKQAQTEAAIAARDVTIDFNQAGQYTRIFNNIIAFLNANARGWAKLARELKERPHVVLPRILAWITLPSLALWWLQKDDEDYQNVPAWQKALAWVYVQRDAKGKLLHIWRLPKPPDLGILFGTVPEMIAQQLYEEDPRALDKFKDALSTLNPLHIPDAIKPLVEAWANKDAFTDKKIVPEGLEDLPPGEQSTARTGEFARAVGKATDQSPAQLEHLVRGYGAGLAQYGLEAANQLTRASRAAMGKAPLPAPAGRVIDKLESAPLLRGFMVRHPGLDAQPVSDALALFDRAEAHRRAWNRYRTAGDKDNADAYFAEHKALIESVATPEDGLKLEDKVGPLRLAHGLIIDATRLSRDADDATRERVAQKAIAAARAALAGQVTRDSMRDDAKAFKRELGNAAKDAYRRMRPDSIP